MTVENRDPWTGEIRRHEKIDAAGIERALAAADAAFPAWVALGVDGRGAYLRKIAASLRARRESIATLMTQDMGKLRREALGEIEKSAAACEYYADNAARYLEDQVIPTEAAKSYVRYEPIGCVLAIMPWNFPIWQVFRFLAPGLMAGNVAVLKHATNVPQCADAIADVLAEAGVPAGVFAVLHIDNEQTAKVIGDPRIKAVTLTGSERAGRSVAATAGQHLKKCVMELGGSDPFVVLEDADLDRTVTMAVLSRYGNAGQTCIAAKRFIVVEAIADAFVERFAAAAARLQPGDPNADGTGIAPMARADLRDELHKQVQASIARGATPLLGCTPGQGATVYPASILDGVKPGMPAYHEELFGPVASIIRVRDEAEAIRVANDTAFGLGASVWTRDKARGDQVARQIAAGACFVNTIVRSDVRLPFGGTKTSGFGRELAEHGIHEFMNIKTVVVD
ncbi:NAD-dependent succinate-semialdehyde dehydrogenase [Arenimonas terrae]|jgi:succinate-semialdehyde dehydrogenase/glutarate-semialdehyde dehydrogenase|uniref:NAD-dependent succinate-semialdehyde dehydrogenase n=1 Tax=Arenimonas terrae TaxID=2546226 RepID=A0A5C4RUC8_9GAMM|nr:NAD-dependent succinate-semialdehyde dehydrogenase [Arenimonas terrae]TNJ34539.1 NAD-dependent succinate-semialdehyde dehydrogenase [Arenimonas terrae]